MQENLPVIEERPSRFLEDPLKAEDRLSNTIKQLMPKRSVLEPKQDGESVITLSINQKTTREDHSRRNANISKMTQDEIKRNFNILEAGREATSGFEREGFRKIYDHLHSQNCKRRKDLERLEYQHKTDQIGKDDDFISEPGKGGDDMKNLMEELQREGTMTYDTLGFVIDQLRLAEEKVRLTIEKEELMTKTLEHMRDTTIRGQLWFGRRAREYEALIGLLEVQYQEMQSRVQDIKKKCMLVRHQIIELSEDIEADEHFKQEIVEKQTKLDKDFQQNIEKSINSYSKLRIEIVNKRDYLAELQRKIDRLENEIIKKKTTRTHLTKEDFDYLDRLATIFIYNKPEEYELDDCLSLKNAPNKRGMIPDFARKNSMLNATSILVNERKGSARPSDIFYNPLAEIALMSSNTIALLEEEDEEYEDDKPDTKRQMSTINHHYSTVNSFPEEHKSPNGRISSSINPTPIQIGTPKGEGPRSLNKKDSQESPQKSPTKRSNLLHKDTPSSPKTNNSQRLGASGLTVSNARPREGENIPTHPSRFARSFTQMPENADVTPSQRAMTVLSTKINKNFKALMNEEKQEIEKNNDSLNVNISAVQYETMDQKLPMAKTMEASPRKEEGMVSNEDNSGMTDSDFNQNPVKTVRGDSTTLLDSKIAHTHQKIASKISIIPEFQHRDSIKPSKVSIKDAKNSNESKNTISDDSGSEVGELPKPPARFSHYNTLAGKDLENKDPRALRPSFTQTFSALKENFMTQLVRKSSKAANDLARTLLNFTQTKLLTKKSGSRVIKPRGEPEEKLTQREAVERINAFYDYHNRDVSGLADKIIQAYTDLNHLETSLANRIQDLFDQQMRHSSKMEVLDVLLRDSKKKAEEEGRVKVTRNKSDIPDEHIEDNDVEDESFATTLELKWRLKQLDLFSSKEYIKVVDTENLINISFSSLRNIAIRMANIVRTVLRLENGKKSPSMILNGLAEALLRPMNEEEEHSSGNRKGTRINTKRDTRKLGVFDLFQASAEKNRQTVEETRMYTLRQEFENHFPEMKDLGAEFNILVASDFVLYNFISIKGFINILQDIRRNFEDSVFPNFNKYEIRSILLEKLRIGFAKLKEFATHNFKGFFDDLTERLVRLLKEIVHLSHLKKTKRSKTSKFTLLIDTSKLADKTSDLESTKANSSATNLTVPNEVNSPKLAPGGWRKTIIIENIKKMQSYLGKFHSKVELDDEVKEEKEEVKKEPELYHRKQEKILAETWRKKRTRKLDSTLAIESSQNTVNTSHHNSGHETSKVHHHHQQVEEPQMTIYERNLQTRFDDLDEWNQVTHYRKQFEDMMSHMEKEQREKNLKNLIHKVKNNISDRNEIVPVKLARGKFYNKNTDNEIKLPKKELSPPESSLLQRSKDRNSPHLKHKEHKERKTIGPVVGSVSPHSDDDHRDITEDDTIINEEDLSFFLYKKKPRGAPQSPIRREVDYLPGIRVIPKKLVIKGRSLGPLRGFSPYERSEGILVPMERKTYTSTKLKFDLISPPRVDGRSPDILPKVKKSKKKRKKKKNKQLSSPKKIETSAERDDDNSNENSNSEDIHRHQVKFVEPDDSNRLLLPFIEQNSPRSTNFLTS